MIKIKSGFTGERAVILPESIIDEYKTSEIGKQLYITDIGFYPTANSHFRERKSEEAKQFILMYCVDGEGWYRINGTTTKVTSNQIFVLPKNKAHAYGCSQKHTWTIYWIHFDGALASYLSENLEKPLFIEPDIHSRINDRIKMFEEIFQTLKNGYSRQNLEYSTLALHYFFGSIKYLNTYRFANTTVKVPNENDVVESAIHFMRENIHKKLNIKSIADYVGISISYFSAVFLSKTAYPPMAYHTHLKIQEACQYLDFTDLKINQISAMVGYDDPLYFSRIFTKTMGISPVTYRKKKKG
jgi:AraC family transcriptional regulator, arabinose operon regulatory protein